MQVVVLVEHRGVLEELVKVGRCSVHFALAILIPDAKRTARNVPVSVCKIE